MKKYLVLFLAFVMLGLVSCSKKDTLLGFKLDTPFTIGHQEQIAWEDDSAVTIKFNQVTEDSRCPIDVECVWAGRVALEVTFSQGGSSQTDVVILGDATGTNYTDTATFGNFSVKIIKVLPNPLADVVIPQSEYSAQLLITKE